MKNLLRVKGILVILAFSVIACHERSSDNSIDTTDNVIEIEQQVENRVFDEWEFERVEFDEPISFDHGLSLRIFDDRLFVSDLADMQVRRYALTGELEASYGEGRGQGPGEIGNIFSFYASERDGVWIVDSSSRTVSHFSYDGLFTSRIYPDGMPMRIVSMGDAQYALKMFAQPELFTVIDGEGEVLTRFGHAIDEPQDRFFMALDGFVFAHPEGGFVWAPRHASYLYFYDDQGVLTKRVALIDGYEFPVERIRSNPTSASNRDVRQAATTTAVSFSDEEMFVNTYFREVQHDGQPRNVLDRYDLGTGQYLGSIAMPPEARRYQVHNAMVYGVADTTLIAYRIHR